MRSIKSMAVKNLVNMVVQIDDLVSDIVDKQDNFSTENIASVSKSLESVIFELESFLQGNNESESFEEEEDLPLNFKGSLEEELNSWYEEENRGEDDSEY